MTAEIIRGDCLGVMRGMPAGSVDAIVTDPPYLKVGAASASSVSRAANAVIPQERQFFDAWMREMWREWARVLKPTGALWLTIDWRGALSCEMAASGTPLEFGGVGVWDKELIGMGFMMRHVYECFAVARMPEWERTLKGESDLWRIRWSTRSAVTDHDAEKPPELFTRALHLLAPPMGGLVLDPFCGSASSGEATLEYGCSYLGIERESFHVATARQRIADAQSQGVLDLGGAA